LTIPGNHIPAFQAHDAFQVVAIAARHQECTMERTARSIPGAEDVHDVRIRWIGHKLQSELHITVNEDLLTYESHHLAEQVRHALFDAQPKLSAVTVHVDPCGHSGRDPHALPGHHQVS
jgi:divalent metal cation (Fe/Co/Zn/Cd) transporter